MRSGPALARRLAGAIIGLAALCFASLASAQSAPAEAAAPDASQDTDRTAAAEAPRRRERRRAQEAPPAAEKTADAELVCKSIRPAGTRLPQRVCQTQAEWDSLTDRSQEDMRRFRDRATASGARPQ